GDLVPHLLGVLLPALADLLAEQLLEVALVQATLPLLGMVYHQVTHESAGQATRPGAGVLLQERMVEATGSGRRGLGTGRRPRLDARQGVQRQGWRRRWGRRCRWSGWCCRLGLRRWGANGLRLRRGRRSGWRRRYHRWSL